MTRTRISQPYFAGNKWRRAPAALRCAMVLVAAALATSVPRDCANAQSARTANAPPVALAGPDRFARVGAPVRFEASPSHDAEGGIVEYHWNLGDGTVRRAPTVTHVFARPGIYHVELTVTDRYGALAKDAASVTVGPARPTRFSVDAGADRVAAPGEPIPFEASTEGALPVSIVWDLGDGTLASGRSLTHAYHVPGRYLARVTAADGSGASAQDSVTTLVNEAPRAQAGPALTTRSLEVGFDGTRSRDGDGTIIAYQWAFGDGAGASGAALTHTYRAPGTYAARLTVTDGSGAANASASDTRPVVILPPPIADAGPPRAAAPGERLVFDGRSSRHADPDAFRYRWNFGDGTFASGPVVRKAYRQPGTYRARLTVSELGGDPLGVDSAEAEVRVNAAPIADAGPDRRIAPGDTVRFDPGASADPEGSDLRFAWDFGGAAGPSGAEVPERAFAEPGRYSITLAVDDGSEARNAVARDTATVIVNHPPVAVIEGAGITARRSVAFDAGGSSDADGDALTFGWDFGDGTTGTGRRPIHTYADGGTYTVTLTVDDGSGLRNETATATAELDINRAPVAVAQADARVCAADAVGFDARASTDPDGDSLAFSWRFPDGSERTEPRVTTSFDTPGIKRVELVVDDGRGLNNSKRTDLAVVGVDPRPLADAGGDRTVCARRPVGFDGSGSFDLDGVVNSFAWDFGDGARGGGDRPVHTYTRAGTYALSLRIEGDPLPRCDNVSIDRARITVVPAPAARLAAPARAAAGATVTFDAAASSAGNADILAFYWELGDGTEAEGESVSHAYAEPGSYKITLRIATDTALADCANATATHGLTVNAAPIADAGPDRTVAAGEPVRFDGSASSDPDGRLTRYAWDFGDGARADTIQPVHAFAPGVYEVALTVADDTALENNTDRDVARVRVLAPPPLAIDGPQVSCPGELVVWSAAGDSDGVDRLIWALGDGTRAERAEVRHVYRRPGLYDVSLTAELGGARTSVGRAHRVNVAPRANAGPDLFVCPGASVELDGRLSADPDGSVTEAVWDLGDGTERAGLRVHHAYAEPGRYTARLNLTDDTALACGRATDTALVNVNTPPSAEAGPDITVRNGADPVVLDAVGSGDPDATDLSFVWDVAQDTLEGRRVIWEPPGPGRYVARVTVSDGSGLSCGIASDAVKVDVLP